LEKDKPPILGLIQRGGEVVLHMLPNVRQATIKPIISGTVASGTLINTDEYDIYARLPAWGYGHNTNPLKHRPLPNHACRSSGCGPGR
jgi:transposase